MSVNEIEDMNLLTTGQMARKMGLSIQSITRYIRLGKLPAFEFNGRLYASSRDFRQFVETSRYEPPLEEEGPTRGRVARPRSRAEDDGGLYLWWRYRRCFGR